MAFHRDYPVRTYQSLIKDLESADKGAVRYQRPRPTEPTDIWARAYKALMAYTLAELRDMAEREGVDMDTVIRKDSKGQLVNAIIRVRKERLLKRGG